MSAITIDNELVHYEVLGRGRPVILLHSWLGSWRYWVPAMQQLSNKFRTYALDFWGFGDSGKGSSRYEFDAQVKLLELFIDQLGISKAALIGHGLGAAVAVAYALKYPDRVPRLMIVSPPLFRMAPTSIPLTANPSPQLPPGTLANVPTPPAAPATSVATPESSEAEKPAAAPAAPTAATPGAAPAATPPAVPAGTSPEQPAAAAGDKPAATPEQPAATPDQPAAAATGPVDPALIIQPGTEAPTMPTKPEELKEAIRAVMEQRAKALGEQMMEQASPLSPKAAATPPSDKPSKEITTSEMQALPQQFAALTAALQGNIHAENPLKDHLGTLDRLELLKKHVEAGANFDKLKAEIEKADTTAIAVNIESMSRVNTLSDLHRLPMPCVAVYGTKDTFLPPPDDSMLTSLKTTPGVFHPVPMDDLRHFPMLESIPEFTRLATTFLSVPATELINLAVDETWKRRVR